jgi:hypothetical protein
MDLAANLAGRLDDVRDQHAPTRGILSVSGMRHPLVFMAPGRPVDPIPATGPEHPRGPRPDGTGTPDAHQIAHGTHDDIRGRASTGWDGALASTSVKAW